MLAAKNGDKNIVKLLLQHGADPNITDINGSSPLHWAAQASFGDIVELLLEQGAEVNEQARGHNLLLLLHVAMEIENCINQTLELLNLYCNMEQP